MFENYERAKKRKAPAWAMPLIVTGVAVHVALVMTMWIRSIWQVEKLELPRGRVSIAGFQAPPPPPPLKGGKKPEDAKKPKEPPKHKVTETVQPTIPQKQVVNEAPAADDGPAEGDPDGDVNGSLDGIVVVHEFHGTVRNGQVFGWGGNGIAAVQCDASLFEETSQTATDNRVIVSQQYPQNVRPP
jgi:hypothetical protein